MKKGFFLIFLAWIVTFLVMSCEEESFDDVLNGFDDYTSDSGKKFPADRDDIDVSMYNQARMYPGLVDTAKSDPIPEAIVTLDLTRRYVNPIDLGILQAPQQIYSTGLYAGAGEKVIIELDEEIQGLSVQVGIHSRDLTSLVNQGKYVERQPLITVSRQLFGGKNEIVNPFGGYIWIRRGGRDGEDNANFKLKIRGAYEAPDYILDETEASEWLAKIKDENMTVPWIELRGKHFAFSVPTRYVRRIITDYMILEKMDETLRLWDDWFECVYQFCGMDDADPNFPMPDFPERAIMDIHLITERFSWYSDDALELQESEDIMQLLVTPEIFKNNALDLAHIQGWSLLAKYPLTYMLWGEKDTTVKGFFTVYPMLPNFYFLYKHGWWDNTQFTVQHYKTQGTNRWIINQGTAFELNRERLDNIIGYTAADSCKSYAANATVNRNIEYSTFTLFSDIISYKQEDTGKDGWKFLSYFNRLITEKKGRVTGTSLDAFLDALTVYFERDFTAFYDRWGLEANAAACNRAAAHQHIEKKIWLYNPLLSDEEQVSDWYIPYDGKVFYTESGKMPYRHDRKYWSAVAYSGTDMKPNNYKGENTAFNLIDGNTSSMWESAYDPYKTYTETDEDGNKITHDAYKGECIYSKATTPELPYSVVFKSEEITSEYLDRVDGIYLVNGVQNDKWIFDSKSWSYTPKRIQVEVTTDNLIYNDDDSIFTNLSDISWRQVYDSNNDTQHQYFPDRRNIYYIDFGQTYEKVSGIRIVFPEVTHIASDKPVDYDNEKYPNRPDKANRNLDRIHKLMEFGTFYYTK